MIDIFILKILNNMTYQEHEDKGREKYDRICTIAHEFTKDKFAKWDVSATGESHTFNVEIKDRDIPFTKYEADGYLLEKNKFDALLEAYRETGSIPVYLNFFQGNTGIWWDLRDINPKWEKRWCTSTTAEGTYGQNKELKDVTFVFPNDGRKFRYE